MKIFTAVAESGGFSKTSRMLGLPLSTISRQVSDLEAYLGVRLLNRSTRKLELSEVGLRYYGSCRAILARVEEAEQCVTGQFTALKGPLTMTAPIVFGRRYLLPVITEFLTLYPDISVRLVLTDHAVDLLEEHIDIALRIGELSDTSMKTIPLGKARHVVCASPGYLAQRGTPQHPSDLAHHACITTHVSLPAPWVFAQEGKKYTVSVCSRLSVTTVEASIDAAVSGVGIARVLSYQIQEKELTSQLVTILKSYEAAPVPIRFLYLASVSLPLKVRTFLDFAAPTLRAYDFC